MICADLLDREAVRPLECQRILGFYCCKLCLSGRLARRQTFAPFSSLLVSLPT